MGFILDPIRELPGSLHRFYVSLRCNWR